MTFPMRPAAAKEPNLVYQDKVMARACATAQSGGSYPPPAQAGRSTCGGNTGGTIGTEVELGGIAAMRSRIPGFPHGEYAVGVAVFGWNSWVIPDNARVIRAYVDMRIGDIQSVDGRSLVGEWYEPTGSGISQADWTATAPDPPNAVDPIPLSSLTPGGLVRVELKDAAEHIDTFSGSSDIRLHISGGQPSGRNRVSFDMSQALASDEWDLHIEYILALRPCVVTPIDGGDSHTVAARADGTPLSWGGNDFGQLGSGTLTSRNIAERAATATAVSVASGSNHTLLLLDDGTVWAAGKNESGQLGLGTKGAQVSVPARVRDLDDVVAVAAGARHSLALRGDGTVWAWGSNAAGQLGLGSTADTAVPLAVTALTGVASIAAGDYHSLAVTAGGGVYAWGLNERGQLGDGSTTTRLAPAGPVLTNAIGVAGGSAHTVAVAASGSAYAWGANSDGQVGDGALVDRTTPRLVSGVSSAVQVATGAEHSLALLSDGRVMAWGANSAGQLGLGVAGAPRSTATAVPGILSGRFVAAGAHHSLVTDPAGEVRGWGSNDRGQLGDGSTVDRHSPTPVFEVGGLARGC